jgi:hypothetical protein
MKYFHEADEEEIVKFSEGKTWGDLQKEYAQPTWCNYPEALNGTMGCWTLCDIKGRKVISERFCGDCDCFQSTNLPISKK